MSIPMIAVLLLAMLWLAASQAEGQTARAEEFIVPSRGAFLKRLDLGRPELAQVKAALERGDVNAAGVAYVAHFRTKAIASPLLTDWTAVKRDPRHNTARADGFLAGRLHDGYSVYDVPPTGLDWRNSPLSCCTRFPILGPLRWAIHHTQDPKYVRFVVDHILGYMRAYPIEDFVGQSTRTGWTSHTVVAKPWYWCMIPERLTELSETVSLIRPARGITDDELLAILHRMYQETGYLRTEIKPWVDRRHNGGCAMIEAMAQSCAILGDFPAAREWLDYDAQLAAQYIDQAFYPDGMCVELTVAYSMAVSAVAQRLAYALREQEAIRTRRSKVEALVTCMVALSDPTGWLPSFGDLYAGKVASGVFPPVLDWLELPWAKTVVRGGDGPLPPFTVWPQPGQAQWCGYYTMRSDWMPQAKFMAIDGGPWGTTHQHGDKLSFVLTAHGAKFIIDPSSTRYASNEPDSLISVQKSGFLHNTLTVDGVDEFRSPGTSDEAKEPLQNRWEHGEGYTLFVGDYSFAPVKPVRWERRVLFADKSYWLLQDVLTGEQKSAEIEQNFQFEADIAIEFQGSMTIAKAPNGAKLVLMPLDGSLKPQITLGDKTPHTSYWPDGKPKQVLYREDGRDQMHGRGWTGRSTHKLMPAPAVTYVGQVNPPRRITVALIPLAPEQPLSDLPKIASHIADGQTTWTLPIRRGRLRFVTSTASCSVLRQ